MEFCNRLRNKQKVTQYPRNIEQIKIMENVKFKKNKWCKGQSSLCFNSIEYKTYFKLCHDALIVSIAHTENKIYIFY